MADVLAIFGVLLIFGITFPGLLAAWWLLFPGVVERARLRVEHTPWGCFWLGGVLSLAALIPIFILLALPFGPAKFTGWLLTIGVLAVSSLGSAGIAAHMGVRLAQQSSASPAGAYLRGAVVLELAAFFPILGWIIVLPLTVITSLGAAGFALLHWVPKTSSPSIADKDSYVPVSP